MDHLNINKINPYLRRACYSLIPKGMGFPSRVILDYDLIHFVEGDLTLIYNGKTYKPSPGQFILLRPGVSHAVIVEKAPFNQPHIHFDIAYSNNSLIRPVIFNDLQNLSDSAKALLQKDAFADFPVQPYIFFKDQQKASELFYNVIDSYIAHQYLLAKSRFTELLDMIIADNFPGVLAYEDNSGCDIAMSISSYIDSSANLNMTLDDFEKIFSYNKFYLEKMFKKQHNTGIISYQNGVKMLRARELLKLNSITTVAEQLGFSSIYTFSRAFKNFHGFSPSEFKKTLF